LSKYAERKNEAQQKAFHKEILTKRKFCWKKTNEKITAGLLFLQQSAAILVIIF
jgi:hypothetical protein